MDFYQVLLEIMEEKSFSIPDVARATGLSDSTIRSIISRKTKKVSLDVAFKMYKGLGVSLERLNGEEIKNTSKDNNLSKEETTLLENYNKLNSKGKERLIDYSDDLTTNIKYMDNTSVDEITATIEDDEFTKAKKKALEARKKAEQYFKENPHLMPIASHDKEGEFTDEDYKHDDDIMNDDDFWNK